VETGITGRKKVLRPACLPPREYHAVPSSPIKGLMEFIHVGGGTGRQNKGTNPTYGIYLGFQSRIGLVSVWTSNDDLKLYAKLADAVKGHSFDLGVALAEGHQTVAMLLNTVRRVTGAVASLKKGRIDLALRHLGAVPEPRHMKNFRRFNPEKVRKVTKSGKVVFQAKPLTVDQVSAMWLEIQYGWRPLYSDVYESMKAYSAITDKSRQSRISVSVKKRAKATGSLANAWTRLDEETVSKRITYEMEEKLSTARSLNLLDPRSAAWEVLPWSFVADWFIPIGTYFSALSSIPHLKGRFLIQQKDVCDVTKIGMSSSVLYSGAKAVFREITYDRTISTTLAVPLPRFKSLRDALSLGHVENALALLQQAVSFKK